MGAVVGLAFGLGLLAIWRWAVDRRGADDATEPAGKPSKGQRLLWSAGLTALTPVRVHLASLGLGLAVLAIAATVSHALAIGVAFGGFAAAAPWAAVRWQADRRRADVRQVWPDAVDNLASAVRAGMSLPEALAGLAERGPESLREPFRQFALDYRASGQFAECLDRLKGQLADPVGDRVVESLRLARDVGGTDLGTLLRALSQFLREEQRTRAELETRQGWTTNAARMAVAAPWILLALLSLRPEAVVAYSSRLGAAVLAGGAAVSFVAYRLMRRLARLPDDERVLT